MLFIASFLTIVLGFSQKMRIYYQQYTVIYLLELGSIIMFMKTASILVLSVFLVACQTPTKRSSGTVLGGVAGGAACSNVGKGSGRTAAIIGCSLIGAMIGASVGDSLDKADEVHAQDTLENSRDNQANTWHNPNTNNQYTVTPTRTYFDSQRNTHCRDYSTEALIDGQREVISGKACRQADGRWLNI